jgi:nicotinamide-nucleotide amidase
VPPLTVGILADTPTGNTIMAEHPVIELLLTGDELMSGDTVDSNSARIAQALAEHNLTITRKTTVGDDLEQLTDALRSACGRARIVIMNGGLGPTQDDLTAAVAAAVAGVGLVESAAARAHVEAWCARRGIHANDANLKQAVLPEGADIIDNPRGSAVGFALAIGDALLLTTPGVPGELQSMLPEVVDRITAKVGGGERHTLRLQTFGIGESSLEALLKEHIADWPENVQLGYRAGMPQLELKLHVANTQALNERARVAEQFEHLFGDHILGQGDVTLAAALQTALRARGLTMTTVESCTGGLIASMMTREPGSSAVFGYGFVTYANEAKRDLVGVDSQLLRDHGAVSEPVVRAMLAGALSRSGADLGVAVSGIAGPEGGSADKPVGTVWIAWGSRDDVATVRLQIPAERGVFQQLVAALGLDLLRRRVLELAPVPDYIRRQSV